MKRRNFLATAGALPWAPAFAQNGAGPLEPYDRLYPDMLASYLVAKLNRRAEETQLARAAITTAPALEARNQYVREKVVEMIGGFPARNRLDAQIVKTIDRPAYRIENVMFQSRPNFWVTANLYIPAKLPGKIPAIISPCGHYPLARMLPQYQFAYQNLARNGFIVLAFDPIGQGERRQYWNPATDVTEVGSPTYEHSMPGQLLFLLGETLTGYRVWDAMRSIDYLLTRPEVDAARIGCTGHSGGGTLTMFTSAVDTRIASAVIHEGGTRNRWPIRLSPFSPLGPADVEQNLFPGAYNGIDNADLHVAIAPRPLMATIEHFSPEFNAVTEHLRSRYLLLGAPNQFSAVAADDPHAWTYKLRLATTDWFSRSFYNRPGPATEPELSAERPENLRCLANGSIRYSKHGDTIWTTIEKKGATLPPAHSAPSTPGELKSFVDSTRGRIRELLRLGAIETPLSPRPLENVQREGYSIEKLAFLSEDSIYIPTWVFQPRKRRTDAPAILFFAEGGKDNEGMEFEGSEASGLHFGVLATMAKRGYQVIAADVRGIGETRSPHRPNSSGSQFAHLFDTETAMSYMAWFLNESLFGMRVHDVLRTVDYALSREGTGQPRVWVIGRDMAALWTLYAAALDSRITGAVCHRPLATYQSLTKVDRYLHGANIIVPHSLEHFDLPRVAACAAGRRLTLLSPVDPMKRSVDLDTARKAYDWTTAVYAAAQSPAKFAIDEFHADQDAATQYLSLLEAAN